MSWLGMTVSGPDEDGLDWEPEGLDDEQFAWALDDLAAAMRETAAVLDACDAISARIAARLGGVAWQR